MAYVVVDGVVKTCRARDPQHCQYHGEQTPHYTSLQEADHAAEEMASDQHRYGCQAQEYTMAIPADYDRPIRDLSRVGLPLVVGGAVRDSFLHADNKDIDLEVYHVDMDDMIAYLKSKDYQVNEVGKRFGVLKVTGNGVHDLDVAVPRSENKVSAGHRGFHVQTDTNMTVPEAASRRDYTINAMAYDPVRHRLIDPYHGAQDMTRHVLRAVGDKFSEDPLRVLRGFQIASRFDLAMDSDTIDMCAGLHSAAHQLSSERIREEWKKFYKRSVNPLAGLQVLRSTGWDDTAPGLRDALSSRHADEQVLRAWSTSSSPTIRAAVIGQLMDQHDAHDFYRLTLPDYDTAKVAFRLSNTHAEDLTRQADRREWSWSNEKRGLNLSMVHDYAKAIGDQRLAAEAALDHGVIQPLITGDDIMASSSKPAGRWVKNLLDDLRHDQYAGAFHDRESALQAMQHKLRSAGQTDPQD
jgi:tRNA nucleotidyltransferase/poly(A) polymerase